jgi:1-acyl-sn-glycerol-3-phosphate acyltransferase
MVAILIRLITGVTARWVGEAPEDAHVRARQRVYFANHTSNLDGPVIWAALPRDVRRRTRPVAARDYWTGGPVRQWLATRVFQCVLIERRKVTRASNPIGVMEEALAGGASLIIFPEGGRAGDESEAETGSGTGEGAGRIKTFKAGLYHLARKRPDVQFVPVFLENLNRILPKGEFILIPLLATARFGEPVSLGEGEAKEAFLSRARDAVAKLGQKGDGHA